MLCLREPQEPWNLDWAGWNTFTCMNLRHAIQTVDQWSLQIDAKDTWFFSKTSVPCHQLECFSGWIRKLKRVALPLSLTLGCIIYKPSNLRPVPFPLGIPIFRYKRETKIFYEWFKDLTKPFRTVPALWWDKRSRSCCSRYIVSHRDEKQRLAVEFLHSEEGKENQLKTSTCISPFTAIARRMDCLVHFMFWVCR